MFDTHCHLNFKVFDGKVDQIVKRAREAGVDYFVVPGTDIETSKKAVEIAEKFKGVYAAVGIHPHHVYQYQISNIKKELKKIHVILTPTLRRGKNLSRMRENLKRVQRSFVASAPQDDRREDKIVAIGEIGLDKHVYQKTKYENYGVDKEFFELQKLLFVEQLKLAKEFKKSVIVHNREAKKDLLKILNDHWDSYFSGRMVFHCCEPEEELLNFAKEKKIFIGVDGDVVYNKKKQEFVKKIPLDLLVLETDSPFLSPLKKILPAGRQVPNEPKNLPIVAKFISSILSVSINQLIDITSENAERLFLK